MDGEYARAWDTGDAVAWAALFTEDGSYETRRGNNSGSGAQGRKGLEEFCRSSVAMTQGIHLCHTPAIEVEGDEAKSWMQFEYRAQTGARQSLHVVGSYRTLYVRTRDGWKIHSRQSQIMESIQRDYFGVPGLGKAKFEF
jgi:uncharacterized protein (TIGR02246 family)